MAKPGIIPNRRARYFLVSVFLFGQTLTSWGNPTGGQVVAGTATINTSPGTVAINQTTSTAIINWQDFSIAAGELTRFQVPTSASATLNRVTGGNVSTIYGTLQSNGLLYLINPNGIVVGASGQINTAGFVASTLNFSDSQFNAQSDLNFSGSSNASVNNQGTIHASTGDVYLIATQVTNSGTITAPQGNVGLAAGSQVLLQKAGDQHLFVQVGGSATPQATGVANTGTIQSATAELKAAGGNAYALAINNSGNIAATGITTINGQVYLTADGGDITNSGQISAQNSNGGGGTVVANAHSTTGATQGTLIHSGVISATGTAPGTTGGTVQLLGDRVGVTDSGVVDVSGDAGGGTALIGGDEHGANPAIPDADNTYLGSDAQVIADALRTGDGGEVILWGNESTQAYGSISVQGGPQGGDGGFVETSGASLQTATIPDRGAPEGTPGTWLLDPTNITITDNAVTTNGFLAPFTSLGAGPYILNQTQLLAALAGGSVKLNAGGAGATGGTGNIIWQQPGLNAFNISSLTNSPTLELDAPGALQLNSITITPGAGTGSLSLVLNSSTTLPTPGNVFISGSTLNLNGGAFTANGNGYASSVNANGDSAGIDIQSSTINTLGGAVNLTGNGGYILNTNPAGLSAGEGINLNNSTVEAGNSGNIMMTGTVSQNAGTFLTSNFGLSLNASSVTTGNGTITMQGTLSSGAYGNAANPVTIAGVALSQGSTVQASQAGGSISITGVTTTATAVVSTNASDDGVLNSGSTVSVNDLGSISITGNSGTATSVATTLSLGTLPNATGIALVSGAQVLATGSSTITLTGTGGTITNGGGLNAAAFGVNTFSGTSGLTTKVSTSAGDMIITGTGGNSPNLGIGVASAGANGGTVTVQTNTGFILITGTGGAGNSGAGGFTGYYEPNSGIGIADQTTVSVTGQGGINLTGHAGSNGSGVFLTEFSTTIDPNAVLPVINGGSNGLVDINGLTSSDAINLTATVSGFDVSMDSSSINLTGATVTTTDPGVSMSSQGLTLGDFFNGSTGQINITNSTITGSSMGIGGYDQNTNNPNSQVSINNSAINLVLGANPPTSNLYLQISGGADTAGSPGVSITNGSSITATGGASGDDNVNIQGTGLLVAGSNAIGVLINGSTLTVGSSGTPGDVHLDIEGQSDSGSSAAAPVTFGAASAFGLEITNGSTITSYSSEGASLHGTAFADNANQAVATLIDSSAVHVFNGHIKIQGSVKTETLAGGGQIGAAYAVEGVELNAATITSSGSSTLKNTAINLDGDVKDHVVATNSANSAIAPVNYGVDITGGSQISASGNTQVLYVPIAVIAGAGAAQSSSSQVATSVGISVSGGSTITNSGLGATVLDGSSGPDFDLTTGSNVVADGVDLTGTLVTPGVVTATGGGSIAIGGLGGAVGSGSTGFSRGINLQSTDVTTNSGVIFLVAAAGSEGGGSTVDLTGLELNSSDLQTGTAGGTPIPGGGTVPPLIMIYATDSTVVLNPTSGVAVFQAGSSSGYAIKEDANSSLTTGNLLMGNYEDLFTAYAPSGDSAGATATVFNTFLSNPSVATFIGSNTINPTGLIDLESSLNDISHLDSALVGSGGLFLDDNSNLTVDPIGTNDNALNIAGNTTSTTDYGQIDGPAPGPVFIYTTGSLTLTNVSPLTGAANPQPVIGTSGAANSITLVTGGTFINDGGASALSPASGATYVIYASDPASVTLDGLNPTPVFSTVFNPVASPAVTGNTVFLASAAPSGPIVFGPPPTPAPPLPSGPSTGGPGDPTNPTTPVTTTITQIGPISQTGQSSVLGNTGNTVTQGTEVVGGASGAATPQDQPSEQDLRRKFANLAGKARANDLINVIREDSKDGSTVNTGTEESKWASNTGLSKIVHIGEYAQVFQGLALPGVGNPFIFNLFQQQGSDAVRNELSQAASGANGNGH